MPHTVGHNPDTVTTGSADARQEITAAEYLGLAMRREAEGDIVGALQYFNKVQGLPGATSQQIETAQGYIQRLKASYPEILDTIASGPVQRAQALFDVGLRLKGQGNTAAANTNFESALDVITAALGTVGQDPEIKTQLEQIRQLTLTEKPDTRKTTATVEQELMDFPGMPTTPLAMGDGFTRTSYVSPLGEDAEPPRSRTEEYVHQISQLLGGIDPQGRPAFGTPAMRSIQLGLESGFADQHTRWLLESAAQPLGEKTQFEDWLGERGLQRPTGDKLPTYWQEAITQGSLFPTLSEQQSIEYITKARVIPLFGTPTSDDRGFTKTLTPEQKWAARAAMGGATTGLFGRINDQRFNSLLAAWENLRRSDPKKYSTPTFLPWVARQLSSDAPGYVSGFSQGTVTTSTAAVPGTASTAAKAVSNAGVIGYTEAQAKEAQNWGNAQADAEEARVERLSGIVIGSVEYNKLTAFEQTLAKQLQHSSTAEWDKGTKKYKIVPNASALAEQKYSKEYAEGHIYNQFAQEFPEEPDTESTGMGWDIPLGERGELTPSEEQAYLNRLQEKAFASQTGIGIESTGMGQEITREELGALTPNQERDLLYRLQTGTEESTGMDWERPTVPEVAAVPSTVEARAVAADIAAARLAGNIKFRQYNLGPYQTHPYAPDPFSRTLGSATLQDEVTGTYSGLTEDPFLQEIPTPQIFPKLRPSPYAGLGGIARRTQNIPLDAYGEPHQWVNTLTGLPYSPGEKLSGWTLAPKPSIYDYMDAAGGYTHKDILKAQADVWDTSQAERNRIEAEVQDRMKASGLSWRMGEGTGTRPLTSAEIAARNSPPRPLYSPYRHQAIW